MEAGEYFQSQSKKRQRAEQDRAEAQVQKVAQRQAQRRAAFQPPEVRVAGLTSHVSRVPAADQGTMPTAILLPEKAVTHDPSHQPGESCLAVVVVVVGWQVDIPPYAAVEPMVSVCRLQTSRSTASFSAFEPRADRLIFASQEGRQSASQVTTDAGADDLKALAARLKKKHRSGAEVQQQINGDRGGAAAFLAGSAKAGLPNGNDEGASGEQPNKKRKKVKVSQDDDLPNNQGRKKAEDGDGLEAALAGATNGKEKTSRKKRKLLKTAEDGKALAAQGSKQQHAKLEEVTADLQRTKKKKAK